MSSGRPVRRGAREAFTLIELLAVVAVIGILATLLFPAVKRALEMSRTVNCLSNMRQVGVGFSLFGADQNGSFPVWYYNGASPAQSGANVWWYWCDLIQPYVDPSVTRPTSGGAGNSVGVQEGSGSHFRSTVFDCLSHKNAKHMEFKYNKLMGRYQGGSFSDGSFNPVLSRINDVTSYFGVRLDAVTGGGKPPPPAAFIVVIDAINRDYPGMDNFEAGGQFMTRTDFLHGNASQFNAVYADGHAMTHEASVVTNYVSGLPFRLPL